MESKIFYSSKCYNIFDDKICNISTKNIYLGKHNEHSSILYLYFDVDSICSNAIIESAYLLFYERYKEKYNDKEKYIVYITPTFDYLNPNFFINYILLLDKQNKKQYLSEWTNDILKIDIKWLVEKWISRNINNYGCMMELDNYNYFKAFSGVSIHGVEPFLKVTYKMPQGKILCCFDEEISLLSDARINSKSNI